METLASTISAYEVKKLLPLILRLLKIKKNGIFLFEISSLVLEIFRFLYYPQKDKALNQAYLLDY